MAANQDLWQLVGAHATATPQLAKVLVRADEGGLGGKHICAAVAVPPSATGEGAGAVLSVCSLCALVALVALCVGW